MAKNSKIEWTHHTANLWWGCTKVHEGCDNCYAETMSHRWGHNVWGDDSTRRLIKSTFKDIFKYQKLAEEQNIKARVFVGSMMDIFEKSKDVEVTTDFKSTGEKRDYFFNEVVPNCPNLIFLLLTKRPSNINKMIPKDWLTNPPANVMFGTSPVNEKTARTLIKQLKQVNGYRFLSVEPQLEQISNIDLDGIDWVIQGGESGHHKRPFNPEWGRALRDICKTNHVPYFFKQIDKVIQIPEDLMVREFPSFQTKNVQSKKNIINKNTNLMKNQNITYSVVFNTIEINKLGTPKSSTRTYDFTDENTLKARHEAVVIAKQLLLECNNDDSFESEILAELKGFKNTKGFTINLWCKSNETELMIFGEDEIEDELYNLKQEAELFDSLGVIYDSMLFEFDGESFNVIEDDFDFFESYKFLSA